ncbi:hypothetical protein FJ651_14705 [Paucihalobacter ruber]|uniref:Uncharacterized protein n=1 Tax=Paucihalobacter ruber TaxID=2567861 RepID=A0A506PBU1_9FLAO|nr:hypothetical protein [Paucihalobacter ruber]TPV31441.1 hypothetical protein FJ651_14705 [Paucihalobacter ruber]
MKPIIIKVLLNLAIFALCLSALNAQERSVKVDFESGSFYNNPKIPYDEPFVITGETGSDIEFVKINIYNEDKNDVLHYYVWNRIDSNSSETFNIVVPAVLRSNSKYDFEIITYKLLSPDKKEALLHDVEDRVRFLLTNNFYFDGKNVIVNKPKDVYKKIDQLLSDSFQFYESKNLIPMQAPSPLILEALNNQSDFKFGRFFKKSTRAEIDDKANAMIAEKVEHLVSLISSEIAPFLNTQLVQHYRQANVNNIETDKESFTLPVNIGMYAWDKSVSIDNISTNNTNFTLGAGITLPFSNRSTLASRSKMVDSFGFSIGVLFEPIEDSKGTKFVTPGVNLPVYTGLGIRFFKVLRFNAGVIVLGEKGNQNFNKLTVIPTAGLALELNLWMGVKN